MDQVENNYIVLYKKITNSAKYGLIIGLFIVVVWYIWAILIYRWSTDRLSNIVVKKYQMLNQNKLTANTFFKCVNVVVVDKTLTCDMQLRNTSSQKVISTEHLVINLITDDSICDELSVDMGCILV